MSSCRSSILLAAIALASFGCGEASPAADSGAAIAEASGDDSGDSAPQDTAPADTDDGGVVAADSGATDLDDVADAASIDTADASAIDASAIDAADLDGQQGDAANPTDATADSADPPDIDASASTDSADAPDPIDSADAADTAPNADVDAASDAIGPPTPVTDCSAQADGTPCDDLEGCTIGDACMAGACVGAAKACDDQDPCTIDSCPLGKDGACSHAKQPVCECKTDADCQPKTGLNLCLGDRSCDAGSCVTLPGTAIVCPKGDDTACAARQCQPATGLCPLMPINDGKLCGEPLCGPVGVCGAGLCKDAALIDCDDADPCTADSCLVDKGGCVHTPLTDTPAAAAPCSDGDACTSADACIGGVCVPGPKLACDDQDPCSADSCDKQKGCGHTAQSGPPCSDGSACTVDDACKGGLCQPGAKKDCDDADPCSADSCDLAAGCTHTAASGAACADGSACTLGDLCKGGVCLPGALTPCDDANTCTADSCDPKTGCVHAAADAAPCNDGSACSVGDSCLAGTCMGGMAPDCDDKDPCSGDSCDSKLGCVHQKLSATAATPAPCSDGSVCTVGDACQGGICLPGEATICDDGDACSDDSCDPKLGCFAAPGSGAPCDDGDACTTKDACLQGLCKGGAALGCDDGVGCTVDSCDKQKGCAHIADAKPCDDGDACTNDGCDSKQGCESKPVDCDDGNPCSDETGCDKQKGCQHADNDKVLGDCQAKAPGSCAKGKVHCQGGVGHCLPALDGLGALETVAVPGGLLERYGAKVGVGEHLLTSNGEELIQLAHGVAGVQYAGWTWRIHALRAGLAVTQQVVVADPSFYADGVLASGNRLYPVEWTGKSHGRVRVLDLRSGKVLATGPLGGDYSVPQTEGTAVSPISGQLHPVTGEAWLGSLNQGAALRWKGNPWQPSHLPPPHGNGALLPLKEVAGAGALATDGSFLYVKRWGGYAGSDHLERFGTGSFGTVAGAWYGRVTLQGPTLSSLAIAAADDGFVYSAPHTSDKLQRIRVSAASLELCDGVDNDCDGSTDEGCHPAHDHCLYALDAKDGKDFALSTAAATSSGPDEPSCGGATPGDAGAIGHDVWVRHVASCNGVVSASLCASGYAARIAAYADACPASTLGVTPPAAIACSAGSCKPEEALTFKAKAGQAFWLRIGGQGDKDVGEAKLTLHCSSSCGDGVVDAGKGEACDDGGLFDNDGCTKKCAKEFCGDGVVQDTLLELCDDGANNSDTKPGACRKTCLYGGCGDGVKAAGEECDLGAANSDVAKDGCRKGCTLAGCGDGVQDSGEACDDGNKQGGDGCGPDCKVEACGDGVQTGAEGCDDGNKSAGDGCSASCAVEICGDSVLQAGLGEACDEGPNGGKTCTEACQKRSCAAQEACNGADDTCDGVVDEGCKGPVVSYTLATDAGKPSPPPQYKTLASACLNDFDCNDENIYTVDACKAGSCTWAYIPCDGPDADSCADGRRPSQNASCVDTGPLLLWDFEEGLEGAVVDGSGGGAHGIPSGGAIDAKGKFGAAFSTNSKAGHVHKPLLLPTSDFTFSAFFKTSAQAGGLFAAVGAGAIGDAKTPTDREVYLEGGKLAYRVEPGGSSRCKGQGPAANDGAWHHAALICQKAKGCQLLLDGVQICASLAFDDTSHLPQQTAFVAGWSQAGGAFQGGLDHVALFGYPLQPADVAALIDKGVLTAERGANQERCNGKDMDCDGKANGACEDADLCTVGDFCSSDAVCIGGADTKCSGPSSACSATTCDKALGVCQVADKTKGTACDDGSSCTSNDVCNGAGKCQGALAKCGEGKAFFPAGVKRDDGKDLGKDILIYHMKGAPKPGCIIPMANELGAFGTWKKVQNTSNSWYHQGPVGFGIAIDDSAKSGKDHYVCKDIWWLLTTDLTVGLDPFTMGGKVTVPFPDLGISKDMALSPPPVSVDAPYLAIGVQSGASLSYLQVPVQPDRDYWFIAGLLGAHLQLGNALPIPFPGTKSVSIVIDPFDPLFYLGLEGLVEIPVGPSKVSLEGIGFSNGGKLLHKSLVDMWFGKTKTGADQLTKLVFAPVANNAHAFAQIGVSFNLVAVPEVEFKVTGQLSIGLDAKGDGFDDTGAADTIWQAMMTGSPAGNDKQKDIRTLLVGNLAFKMPLKKKNASGKPEQVKFKLGSKEFPVALGFALAQSALLIDSTPGEEVVALRAATTKMPWESVPVLKDLLASFNFKLDVNGYWKAVSGVSSGGFALEVVTPTPIRLPGVARAIPFRGMLMIDSDSGFKLQGSFDFGKFSWFGAEFDMGTVGPVEASYDGEKFCLGAAVTVPKSFKKEGGGTENTTCSLIPCFGKNGFEGSKVSCKPFCFTHSECPSDQRCIWGTCQAPLANTKPCSDNAACGSGRCLSGFCVECWPGSSECSGGKFCDNAGYCQGQLENGAACVSLANGVAFARHSWCKSGKCDTQCVECLPRGPLHEPAGPLKYDETCPSGKFCDAVGYCQKKIAGGAPCVNVKQAMGVDAWCEFGDCHDVAAVCQDCGKDTKNVCAKDSYCLGYGCQKKVADDTACLLPEACLSGTCGVGVVAGTGAWCYSANSKDYGAACKVAAACKSGGCRLLDGKCGCNGKHDVCASDQFCDGASTCVAKKPNGVLSICVNDVECKSGHCSGICVQCQQHSHCGSDEFCGSSSTCEKKKKDSSVCLTPAECSSGKCTAGICGACTQDSHCGSGKFCAAYLCYDKKAFGEGCLVDAECKTGYCNGVTCRNCKGANTGCSGSQFCDGSNCANKKGYGSACGSAAECSSNQCSAVFTCGCASNHGNCGSGQFCDGTFCQNKKGGASLCGSSAECSSGICKWNGIANACGCGSDAECGGGDFCNGSGNCQADFAWSGACSRSAQCGAGTSCKNHPYNCNPYNCNAHSCCQAGLCLEFWCCSTYTCYDTCYNSCNNYWCDY